MGWIGTKWVKGESVKDFLAEKCFGSNFEILFYSSIRSYSQRII